MTNAIGSQKPNPADLAKRHEEAEKSLSSRYDALGQLLGEAELHLRALKPIRPVWVHYNHQDLGLDGFTCCELLGMVKRNDKWRLCHAVTNDLEGEIEEIQPIIECPVEVRLRAAKEVRSLHEEVVKAKEKVIPEIDSAIKELTDLCSMM